ncbi:MAG: PAS domain-containing protein [bacterium]
MTIQQLLLTLHEYLIYGKGAEEQKEKFRKTVEEISTSIAALLPMLSEERERKIITAIKEELVNMVYLSKEEKEIPVNLYGSIMKDSHGQIFGIITVARDMREIRKFISDLKKAYRDLQKKEINKTIKAIK